MIRSLRFRSGYPLQLDGVGPEPFAFTKRINLLVGPNGAGKSTVLYTLAALSGCGSGGWSDPGRQASSRDLPYEAEIDRDDWPVFFQDCFRDSDNSFIDTDYLERKEVLRSTGEKRIGLMNELIDHIEERFPTFRLRKHERPTLILDEIDNHVGFAGQAILWREIVPKLSKKYQLIISTHSIFPLLLRQQNLTRRDNLIELAPDYAAACVAELQNAVGYFNLQGDGSHGTAAARRGAPGI